MSGADNQRLPLKEKFELMPETLGSQFRNDFPPYIDGLVKSFPNQYVTTPEFAKKAEDVYNLNPRPDDVYISTFPKCGKGRTCISFSTCFFLNSFFLPETKMFEFPIKILGTTWVQELVWMVVNDCDFEKGKKEQLSIRSPFLE
jgi:hypothetical protein